MISPRISIELTAAGFVSCRRIRQNSGFQPLARILANPATSNKLPPLALIGAIASRQQTLLRQLRKRFGNLPKKTAAIIDATQDIHRLDAWLDDILTAESLQGMGISKG